MKKYKLVKIVALLTIIAMFLYTNNNMIEVTEISISSLKIPENFSGYKIVQISDLHSKSFGKNQRNIINKIKKLNPNIIVVTGDIVDRRRYNEENSIIFIKEAMKIAQVYYTTGNHEAWSGRFKSSLEGKLLKEGVKLLRNEADLVERDGNVINIVGVDDPAFNTNGYGESYKDAPFVEEAIRKAVSTIDIRNFTILLSHRPELVNVYKVSKIDLVFAGHAHGGQIRLPLIGGLIAPNQGVLPKYTSGEYKFNNCSMIVSRGLGNSIIPFRIFNRPNIVSFTLK